MRLWMVNVTSERCDLATALVQAYTRDEVKQAIRREMGIDLDMFHTDGTPDRVLIDPAGDDPQAKQPMVLRTALRRAQP